MNIYTIYKATNTINGKVYIGFDSKWPRRKTNHKNSSKHKKNIFHKAIKKYGWENFSWEIIYQAKEDVETVQDSHTLSVMEPYFISEYKSYIGYENSNGYNMTIGGQGVSHDEKISTKKRKTCFSKYGVENVNQVSEFREKSKETCLENYGVEYVLQVPEIKEKSKQTKKLKYGDENYNNREKAKETWLELYGVENPSQSEEIKEKKKETSLLNFGDINYMKSTKGLENYQKQMLQKYGVKSYLYVTIECPHCEKMLPVCHIHQCKLNPERNVYDRHGNKNPRAIRIIMNSIEYGTIKEAAKILKVAPATLSNFLKGKTTKLPQGVWELKYA